MRCGKKNLLFIGLFWFAGLLHASAQPMQLPSLFNESDLQNNTYKNSILKPGEDPQEKIQRLVFIKTTISKKQCYVGEPILVTYQLYTASILPLKGNQTSCF